MWPKSQKRREKRTSEEIKIKRKLRQEEKPTWWLLQFSTAEVWEKSHNKASDEEQTLPLRGRESRNFLARVCFGWSLTAWGLILRSPASAWWSFGYIFILRLHLHRHRHQHLHLHLHLYLHLWSASISSACRWRWKRRQPTQLSNWIEILSNGIRVSFQYGRKTAATRSWQPTNIKPSWDKEVHCPPSCAEQKPIVSEGAQIKESLTIWIEKVGKREESMSQLRESLENLSQFDLILLQNSLKNINSK